MKMTFVCGKKDHPSEQNCAPLHCESYRVYLHSKCLDL